MKLITDDKGTRKLIKLTVETQIEPKHINDSKELEKIREMKFNVWKWFMFNVNPTVEFLNKKISASHIQFLCAPENLRGLRNRVDESKWNFNLEASDAGVYGFHRCRCIILKRNI